MVVLFFIIVFIFPLFDFWFVSLKCIKKLKILIEQFGCRTVGVPLRVSYVVPV